MSEDAEGSAAAPRGRGRGRGRSRGGLGKYLRARGRGRGRGRPAEFGRRLLLEGEGAAELDEEEQKEYERELQERYGRRQLGTNADRYVEPEPEVDSEGLHHPSVGRDRATHCEKSQARRSLSRMSIYLPSSSVSEYLLGHHPPLHLPTKTTTLIRALFSLENLKRNPRRVVCNR